TSPEDIDAIADLVRGALEKGPFGEEQRKRMAKDVTDLARDLKGALVEPGAALSFAFTTERGVEGYDYDFTRPGAAEARPLSLLAHGGGDPIFAAVTRVPYQPEGYQQLVKWVKVLHGHAEEFVLGQLDDNQKEAYDKAGKVVYPLLRRLDQVTGKMLLPAL